MLECGRLVQCLRQPCLPHTSHSPWHTVFNPYWLNWMQGEWITKYGKRGGSFLWAFVSFSKMFSFDDIARHTHHLFQLLRSRCAPPPEFSWLAETVSAFPHQPRGFSVLLCAFCSRKAQLLACPWYTVRANILLNTRFPRFCYAPVSQGVVAYPPPDLRISPPVNLWTLLQLNILWASLLPTFGQEMSRRREGFTKHIGQLCS